MSPFHVSKQTATHLSSDDLTTIRVGLEPENKLLEMGEYVPGWVLTLVVAAIISLLVGCARSAIVATPTSILSPTVSRATEIALQVVTTETAVARTVSPPTPVPATALPTVEAKPAFSLVTQLGGTVDVVDLAGSVAYLGVGPRLALVDISQPSAPRFLGQSDVLPDLVQAVAAQANTAYVGTGRGILHVFDITDPEFPLEISRLDHVAGSGKASWIDIFPAGDIVYAVNRRDDGVISLAAIDISDPLQPVVVETRDLPQSAAVTISENILYIVTEGQLQLVDAAGLDLILGEIGLDFEVSDVYGWRYRIAVAGHLAYIGIPNQPLQVLDVSNPAQPQVVASGQPVLSLFVRELAANDGFLYLLDKVPSEDLYFECPSLLRVIDFSEPTSPRLIDEFDPQGCTSDIDIDGSILAAANGDGGLQIIDAGDPANLTLSSEWVPPAGFTSADNIALSHDNAFITSGDVFYQGGQTRLFVLDRSQSGALTAEKDALDLDLRLGDSDARVYVRDGRLYIAGTIDPMILLDISEPSQPQLVAHEIQDPRPVPAPSGNILYAAVPAEEDTLGVVDLSDPVNPLLITTFLPWPEGICDLSITDRYLVAASCAGSTNWLFDISDPVNPVEVGQYELWSNSMPVAYADVGGTLFYLDQNALFAQDISDPAQLDFESNRVALELPFEADDMVLAGDTLYLSGYSDVAEIWAVDVSDVLHPSLVGQVELPSHDGITGPCFYACGMAADGDRLYIARDRAGLFVFELGEGNPGAGAAFQPTTQPTMEHADTQTGSTASPAPASTSVPRPAATSAPTLAANFTPVPAPTMRPSGNAGVEVVYVDEGELKVWNEGSNRSRTIYSEGGVDIVMASDDGQLVAFTRSWVDFNGCNQLALWVVGIYGENPRELVSPVELRQQYGFGDNWEFPSCANTFLNFFQAEWLPHTRQLLYSLYPGDSHTYPSGVYRVDIDSGNVATLLPAGNSVRFVPSPDGRRVALMATTALSFINADGSDWRHDVLTYPETGVPTPYFPNGVWTQDARSFLLVGPIESESRFVLDYSIWRVPVDGSAAQPLATITDSRADYVTFSPDGSRAAFPAAMSTHEPLWSITPLPTVVGPLAASYSLETLYANLQWSPAGTAYAFSDTPPGGLDPLCPDATQASEVCGNQIYLGEEGISAIRWIDGVRFVFLTASTQTLSMGRVDGTVLPITEDGWWGSWDIVPTSDACLNDSEFVEDLTIPDGTHFAPGETFIKTWRLRNSGTCTWDTSYHLNFISGEAMNGQEHLLLEQTVLPGEDLVISIGLIAPHTNGTYRGQWQLTAADGTPFGDKPYVEIVVP